MRRNPKWQRREEREGKKICFALLCCLLVCAIITLSGERTNEQTLLTWYLPYPPFSTIFSLDAPKTTNPKPKGALGALVVDVRYLLFFCGCEKDHSMRLLARRCSNAVVARTAHHIVRACVYTQGTITHVQEERKEEWMDGWKCEEREKELLVLGGTEQSRKETDTVRTTEGLLLHPFLLHKTVG